MTTPGSQKSGLPVMHSPESFLLLPLEKFDFPVTMLISNLIISAKIRKNWNNSSLKVNTTFSIGNKTEKQTKNFLQKFHGTVPFRNFTFFYLPARLFLNMTTDPDLH